MTSKTRVKACSAHHWVLPAPGGPTSRGTCKFCGAEKEFSNTSAGGWVLRPAAKRRTA